MKKWLAAWGLVVAIVQSASAWKPAGWVYFDWPWAYDVLTGEWHWFVPSDVQWVHAYPPGNG